MSSRLADPAAPPKRAAWWTTLTGQVVLLYAVTRVISGIMLAATAPQQLPAPMTGGEPVGYLGFTAIWDGEWYQRVAEYGYPSTLPTDAAGGVRQNQWAFYPLFPMAARLLMWLTGLPFAFVGSTLALLLGFAAAVVMARLLAERIGDRAALAVVGLYAVFPAAPVLQVAYTESLAMLLLCGYLLAISRERWLVATGLALLIGLTRPIAVPLGVVTLVAVWLRWRRRGTDPLPRREALSALAALVGCGVAGLLWPAIAWLGAGRPRHTPTPWAPGRRAGRFGGSRRGSRRPTGTSDRLVWSCSPASSSPCRPCRPGRGRVRWVRSCASGHWPTRRTSMVAAKARNEHPSVPCS